MQFKPLRLGLNIVRAPPGFAASGPETLSFPTFPHIPAPAQARAGGEPKCYEFLRFLAMLNSTPPPDLPPLFFRKEAKIDTQERLAANLGFS